MSSARAFSYMHLSQIEMLEKLHAQFLQDPLSVEPSWRYFFEGVEFGEYQKIQKGAAAQARGGDDRVVHLIDAYRRYGHLQAAFNPILGIPPPARELKLSALHFKEEELKDVFPTYGILAQPAAELSKIIETLKEIYCGSKGIEYIGFHSPELEQWLQSQIEPSRFHPRFTIQEKKKILEQLSKAELFETFLHTKYVGQKRFSLEGGETLIPILSEIIEKGSELGIQEFVIGMAHRGRLNVLANVLNKSFSMIFSEFEDFYDPQLAESAGDVKYHKGFSSNITTTKGGEVHISLTANPSHLESVDPVVMGKARAKQVSLADEKRERVLPLLIHGDASLSGQGVVYETLQLYQLEGYATGGTIHIVVNNHIGFTTLPQEYRSTHYCTDIALAFGFPVFHVNAEDPEGCVLAAQLALRIRHLFQCDVFIDMNCYRKYGHNESDEPAFTQPLEYQLIRKKKSIREIFRDSLIQQGVLEKEMALALEEDFKKSLHFELEELKLKKESSSSEAFGNAWKEYHPPGDQELFKPVSTGVDKERVKEVVQRMCTVPQDLEVHKKLVKLIDERRKMGEGRLPFDWSSAELLALGTLLWEGTSIRMAGQDVQRGTFTQRHAVWVNQKNGEKYFPLAHLKEGQGKFDIFNSPLSEFAALGFELGYSLANPAALVLWEAQFGDFANGAQVIFDQYIAASAQKWQRYTGLTVLLPHGYEGQGAEHSSARLERFLQLAAETNIQIVYPTTPAQYFHLLRRQVIRDIRIPLIVFTPKGLLRHPECVSPLEEFVEGGFQEILDDPEKKFRSNRLLICSGRIYYDLFAERKKRGADHVSIIRLEQLYPLHQAAFMQILDKYPGTKEFYWVQEEPQNMGAYNYLFPLLQELLRERGEVRLIARKASASTATGKHQLHEREHQQLMEMAFS